MKNALKMLPQTMLSTEIVAIINELREDDAAVLAHGDFMKKAAKVLGSEVAGNFSSYYIAENGKKNPCLALPKRETMLMVMSESYKVQAAVYDRMEFLEKPLTPAEMFLQSAQLLLEQDRKLTEVVNKVDTIETKVEAIQVDLRNGVPQGHISKKIARQLYSRGLSKEVFESVMLHFKVPTKNYIHVGTDGNSTPTFAYKEDRIPEAISYFIEDLKQTTAKTCYSKMLNKSLRFEKIPEIVAA